VCVGLDEKDGDEGGVEGKRLWVVKLANDVTYKRLVKFRPNFFILFFSQERFSPRLGCWMVLEQREDHRITVNWADHE
jgi:hypothetical protein